ncbi:MAG: translation initiation factor IF-2 [Spirochaetia bacterium]|nr:translation initiation factor IF-2 [Spirochaetia bacterium]
MPENKSQPVKKKITIKKPLVESQKARDISDTFSNKAEKKPERTAQPARPVTGAPAQTTTPPQTGNPTQSAPNPRPEGTGSQPPRPQGGTGTGGYQGQRPQGGTGTGGYQGQRPQGGTGTGGYQGQRPQGGTGTGGYQGQRPQGGTGTGGYQGQRPAGPGGNRGPRPAQGGTPFDSLLETVRKAQQGGATPVQRKAPGPVRRGPISPERRRAEEAEQRIQKMYNRIERKKKAESGTTVPKLIEIMESIQVGELAKKLNLKPGDVISRLMKMGEMVTINKVIDSDTATLLAGEFGCEVKVVSLYEETVIQDEESREEDRTPRPPVVTIMGHVDHGKTRLLDTIRKTNVVATEAGAITQHIGAYQVTTASGKKITFLDTPGHEAFTAMRARGAAITDIVVLVVAADDGVKEQTVEAITHAQEAKVPIIVAVNKIDLPTANVEKLKQSLATHGLQSEDWGGQTIFCEISAKANIGIDHLLEMILLQADILALTANPTLRAVGRVVEARIDPGKGPVATVLIQKGTLREGDPYVVGVFSGRVRAMFDSFGHKVAEAGPATPIEITGIDGVPEAGDPFTSVINEKYGREIASKRQHFKQISDAVERVQPTLGDLKTWIQDHKEVKVIIKADVQGSVEAIRDGLLKLSTDDVKVRVIFGATGAISESDVTLASASNAIIVGFQIRATPRAADLAEKNLVEIKYYNVIYNVIEEIRAAMEGMLEPDKVEEITGRAEIRALFKISRLGNIAGCMIISGKMKKSNKARLIRDGVVIYTGNLKSLRRGKDDAAEVAEGYECGMAIEGYNDVREGDIIEGFEVKEVARKL